jgi:hypothetical protein
MGADNHLYITNPQKVSDFFMNVLEDAIYASLHFNDYPPDDSYDTYHVNLSKDELVIQFLTDDEEVPGEEIVVKTIKMNPSHYWEIYNRLVDDFNSGLNENPISDIGWDNINDDFEVNSYIDSLDNEGMNYTYWDTEGFYDETIFEYFDSGNSTAVKCIYNNIRNWCKKNVWYDTFFNIFPDFDTFLENLGEYKDNISTDSYQVWT